MRFGKVNCSQAFHCHDSTIMEFDCLNLPTSFTSSIFSQKMQTFLLDMHIPNAFSWLEGFVLILSLVNDAKVLCFSTLGHDWLGNRIKFWNVGWFNSESPSFPHFIFFISFSMWIFFHWSLFHLFTVWFGVYWISSDLPSSLKTYASSFCSYGHPLNPRLQILLRDHHFRPLWSTPFLTNSGGK